MNKEKLQDLAQVKNQIKFLKEKEIKLVAEVTEDMNKENLGEVNTEWGMFSFTTRKKYEYPVYVTELEKTFKSKKKESELNGDAKFEENTFLTFREAKGE